MKGVVISICLLLGFVNISSSQQLNVYDESAPVSIISLKQKTDIRISILKRFDKYIKSEALFKMPKNNMVLISVAIFVDSLGNIKNVFFSGNVLRDKSTIIIVNDNLIYDLKKMPVDDPIYRNKILIFPILFKRPQDDKISNLNEFLKDFSSLWPVINTDSKHEMVLLQPFINDFFDPIN
ncbi:hypothetical protein EV200_1162 [Pedobacter psychrotolerans]|uniref:Uncharacterized protein n=1 Tax=Pedobacter psychrotolerans TaxID=1843235 RepID=A0A4R2H097_9SPHI|nr:hypothetical protein [Pedobacter psychrotolerans]TCO17539.1 hypothetical protein EV200_1162 [Pedobacter psychrotolerans]GGE71359.1 hypothetical protein GCM10011413_42660 [Pedobacter psychrotolerans]